MTVDLCTVRLSAAAQRGLRRLPERVAPAVVEFVTTTLLENPQRLIKPLRGDLEGLRSARRGDYRVILRLIESTREILLVRIAHLSAVYRR